MKRKIWAIVIVVFFLLAGNVLSGTKGSELTDQSLKENKEETNKFFNNTNNDNNRSKEKEVCETEKEIADIFAKSGKVVVLNEDADRGVVEFLWFDEKIPLTINILMSSPRTIEKIIYLLPGSGSNFKSSFLTPTDNNLANCLRDKGYLVVGITPRENNIPYFFQKCAFLKEWGLEKHRDDVRKVINAIEERFKIPYEVLGYSAGGMYALDYASVYHADKLLKRIIVLGMVGEYDPVKEKNLREKAVITEKAIKKVIENGTYIDNSMSLAKILLIAATIFPYGDSGMERTDFPADFTNEGLFYYAMIYTNQLNGPTTKYTGLPENWYYKQGLCSGEYIFYENPKDDKYRLEKSNISVVKEASLTTGSGIFPYKTSLDFFSVLAGGVDYSINFGLIKTKVTWINSELGMGNHSFALNEIREGGNSDVNFYIVSGYGHADLVYGNYAKRDVWSFIN